MSVRLKVLRNAFDSSGRKESHMNPNDAGGWGDKDGMNDKKRNRIDYTQTTQYVRMKRKHVLANIQQEG